LEALTKRQEFIKSIFLPKQRSPKKTYLPEEDVLEIISKIYKMGERYGFVGIDQSRDSRKSDKRKHKFDVWIAKEIKKDFDRKTKGEEYLALIDRFDDFRRILDWVINDESKPDLFKFSFNDAIEKQKEWHDYMIKKYDIEEIEIPDLDEKRIVFRFKKDNYFLYKLTSKDLPYEGKNMNNCVGGKSYQTKVKKGRSIILSLRDSKNQPHITFEINVEARSLVQKYGNSNKNPKQKYEEFVKEFLLFACDYPGLEDGDALEFLNINF
jgi:hypothetical protein